MPERPSRRDLLKTGVIAGAGIGGVLAPTGPAAALPVPAFADVVVVGAGYAGMSAAWELHKKRKRVIVLDANPRVGGRVWSSTLSNGFLFEIGGQWVGNHDAQPDVRQLMDELGVGENVYEQYDDGVNVFVGADHSVSTYDPDDLPPISEAAQLELVRLFAYSGLMSLVVNPEAPWEDAPFPWDPPLVPPLEGPQTTREADQWSIESWLQINSTDPDVEDARALFRNAVGGELGLGLS